MADFRIKDKPEQSSLSSNDGFIFQRGTSLFHVLIQNFLGFFTTDDLTEGSTNKYFNGKDTDDLPEGATNKYASQATVELRMGATTSDSLPEGATNEYYTDAKVDTRISALGVPVSVEVDLSNADIKNAFSSPVEVIEDPGAGNYYEVISSSLSLNVSTAFSAPYGANIGTSSGGAQVDFTPGFMSSATSEIQKGEIQANPALKTNEALLFYITTENPTDGAGTTGKLFITYIERTI